MSADRRLRPLLRAAMLVLATAMTSGCVVTGVSPMIEAVRDSYRDDISKSMQRDLLRLRDIPYAQLYARFPDREEAVFLLAQQDPVLRQDLWIGSHGVSMVIQGPAIRSTSGLTTDIAAGEPLQPGAVAQYLAGSGELRVGAQSVGWLQPAGSRNWIEQIGTVEQLQNVEYEGFAYTGPALRITERVRTTGKPGSFQRRFWVEPRARALLRMETRLLPDSGQIVLEWIRVPDRSDSR